MSNSDMFLWWGSGSVPCLRVQITLEEKGLGGYPNKLVQFSKKEHKGEDVMKINPRGQVPTFKHGDVVVNESLATCDYIDSTFANQGTKLTPDDPAKRALVLQRKFETLNIHKKGIEELVYLYWRTKPEDRKQEVVDEKMQNVRDELVIWEGYLDKLGGDCYIAGSDFTMADVFFWPLVAFLWRVGLKLEKYPRLKAYFEKVQKRPSIQAAWPPHWKDSPNQTHLENL